MKLVFQFFQRKMWAQTLMEQPDEVFAGVGGACSWVLRGGYCPSDFLCVDIGSDAHEALEAQPSNVVPGPV